MPCLLPPFCLPMSVTFNRVFSPFLETSPSRGGFLEGVTLMLNGFLAGTDGGKAPLVLPDGGDFFGVETLGAIMENSENKKEMNVWQRNGP